MYFANLPTGISAKYFYKNKTIYFANNIEEEDLVSVAIHECIHYLQEAKDSKGKLIRLGLYDLNKQTGLALNEAAVQLIAVRTVNKQIDTVKYFGMSFISESPEFYPLECALLSQMTFFTGNEAMYFSTLYGIPMFEKTFKNMSDDDTYFDIEMDFDKLLETETDLAILSQKLQTTDTSIEKSKLLQLQIEAKKKSITKTCTKIQNKIIETCFKRKFMDASTFDDLRELETDLNSFQNLLIKPANYTFYDEFCEKILKDINFKKDQIIKYGKVIDIPKEYSNYLPIVVAPKKLSKIHEIINTLKEFILG